MEKEQGDFGEKARGRHGEEKVEENKEEAKGCGKAHLEVRGKEEGLEKEHEWWTTAAAQKKEKEKEERAMNAIHVGSRDINPGNAQKERVDKKEKEKVKVTHG